MRRRPRCSSTNTPAVLARGAAVRSRCNFLQKDECRVYNPNVRSSAFPGNHARRVGDRSGYFRFGADGRSKRLPDEGAARPDDTGRGAGRIEEGQRAFSSREDGFPRLPGPAEIIFDAGIGDTFNARIAGNVVKDDLLGSLEFACAVAGAKVLLLFGHTACGAIKGAIDDVEMGNLTGLLARVKPAITATTFDGAKSSKNAAYVDAVARTNVMLGLDNIRRRSPILADLEKKKSIQIVGGMYDLVTGIVEFLPQG